MGNVRRLAHTLHRNPVDDRLGARAVGRVGGIVYGGKAFAGVLAAVRNGVYRSGDAILFHMTGGAPGLFAYRRAFDPAS